MEKGRPHHDLSKVKELARCEAVKIVATAARDAGTLGFSREAIIDVIASLSNKDFYKSMTAYHDNQCWHDVYRPLTNVGRLYVKLILQDDVFVVVVSFKEK